MHAIDTNVVVRLLIDDDHRQASAALKLVIQRDVFVPITVILESEWVMRSGYGFGPARIASGLRKLGGFPNVSIEQPGEVAQALEWLEQGMDFADALHLVRTTHCDAFVTFDRRFAKRAKALGTTPVEVL